MTSNSISADILKDQIERIENLAEEKKQIQEDIKDIYSELKAQGFNTNIVRMLVSMRAEDPAKRAEKESLIEVYKTALGMD